MNFRPHRRESPELNLIPMIDVLIVLLIFLVLTTTFSREAELQISLPEASGAPPSEDKAGEIEVVIDHQGHYIINSRQTVNERMETVRKALREAVGEKADPLIVIDADRNATHQSVMTVLDAAGQLGYKHVTFAAKDEPGGGP
ncbi:ExbD/TolR family protein [Methylomagnum sp.]